MDIYLVFASYRVLVSISAGQVPMQCSSPMPFITTYVGFNYCRSIRGNYVHYTLCEFYINLFLNREYSKGLVLIISGAFFLIQSAPK